jgi:hypothetical protein
VIFIYIRYNSETNSAKRCSRSENIIYTFATHQYIQNEKKYVRNFHELSQKKSVTANSVIYLYLDIRMLKYPNKEM